MILNRKETYNGIRKEFGKLAIKQVQGFEVIFNEWEKSGYSDLRWLAYMLATAWHETAQTMQPIAEYGKGKNRPYGKRIKHSGRPYTDQIAIYYGRGYVQLTWYENYELMGRLLGINLLEYPTLAMKPEIAVKIMFEGMTRGSSNVGDFTGKCLEMYFNDKTNDPKGARRIINGTDRADLIAEHHEKFLKSIIKA